MRSLISLATLVLIASPAAAQHEGEVGTYRYGGTYNTVGTGSAGSCAALCNEDEICKAWSFQRATAGLGDASCELKSTIGRSVSNPLMTSGINPRLATVGQARQRRLPSTDTLLGAPDSSPSLKTIVRNSTASSIPATPAPLTPPPAPVEQAPTPAPQPVVLTPSEIEALVTKSERPAASVVRETPAPQVSFKPLEETPPTPPKAAAAAPSVTPAPEAETDTITFPTTKRASSETPPQLNTVPASSVPAQPADPAKPYKNLRNRTYPTFSVNSGTTLTGEELAQQDALANETTIESVQIDSVDLASDIGAPIVQDQIGNTRQTVPSGGGRGS